MENKPQKLGFLLKPCSLIPSANGTLWENRINNWVSNLMQTT